MIFKIIFFVLVTICVALFVSMFEDIKKSARKKISFKEALDLVELPVVTFICGNKKLNLLIDTGANNSILNESVAKSMKLKCQDIEGIDTNTAGGNISLNKAVNINIKYDDKRVYNEDFLLSNMDEVFESIKEESGVMIHGILGSNFFIKHKYIIDYDSLALYVR